jgi:hypothetical protein
VQSVKMTLVEGLQAKPLGVKRGGVHWWFRVRPNVGAKLPAEADDVSLVCEGAEGAARQACDGCRSGSA